MKKIILIMLAFVLFGCNKLEINSGKSDPDMIWDFVNYSVGIMVTDASGNDLLNDKTPGNLMNNLITIEYKGRKFTNKDPQTYANMPAPLAFRKMYVEQLKRYGITFGEFSPERNYHGETFTIDWGDGKPKDTFKFDLYITWNRNDPTVHRKLYHNGTDCGDKFSVEIVK